MKRREFLTAASVGGAAAATAPAAAQETATPTPSGTQTGDGGDTATGDGGGGTVEVAVGPGGDFVFEPGTSEPLYITPGTTVHWVWESDTHNIVVEDQPEDSDWQGHETIENTGFEYEHTFEVLGEYHYYCQPHRASGMVADIVVNESGEAPGGGDGGGGGHGGGTDLHELGVPIQAHFVGFATVLMVLVSLVYTFFALKYGESPHASGGGGN